MTFTSIEIASSLPIVRVVASLAGVLVDHGFSSCTASSNEERHPSNVPVAATEHACVRVRKVVTRACKLAEPGVYLVSFCLPRLDPVCISMGRPRRPFKPNMFHRM